MTEASVDASRLQQLADQVAEEHVVVDPSMGGPQLEYVREQLHEAADALPFSVYVALVPEIPGDDMPAVAPSAAAGVTDSVGVPSRSSWSSSWR